MKRYSELLITATVLCGIAWLTGCDRREVPPPQDQPPQVEQNVVENTLDEITTELEIQLELLNQLGADGLAIDTEIAGNDVTLTGEVFDPASSTRAGEIVAELPDVHSVVNEIIIEPVAEPGPDATSAEEMQQMILDKGLEISVKLRLYAAIGLDAEQIDVEVADGEVILSGWLPNEAKKTEALAAAENAIGEAGVIDGIQVTQPVVGVTGG